MKEEPPFHLACFSNVLLATSPCFSNVLLAMSPCFSNVSRVYLVVENDVYKTTPPIYGNRGPLSLPLLLADDALVASWLKPARGLPRLPLPCAIDLAAA